MNPILIYLGVGSAVAWLVAKWNRRSKGTSGAPKASLFGNLPKAVQEKVATVIRTSESPAQLRALGDGLAAQGATGAAVIAHEKANIVQREQAPFTASMVQAMNQPAVPLSTVASTPGGSPAPAMPVAPGGIPTLGPTSYKIASGDTPSTIAKRFGISLAALAGANPKVKANLLAGKIAVGQVLALPPTARDSGPIAKAKGVAA